MVNKFNLNWQLVRVRARKIKDVDKKVAYVLSYLDDNKNRHDRDRVLNWLRMTSLGYANADRIAFNREIERIESSTAYASEIDNVVDLGKVSKDDILMVLGDLKKRKYDFRFGGKVPEDHKEFVEQLEKEIEWRT